ncbi:MAG: CoA transferase [Ilumatobacteraceae bacterium]|nr:CoA transferase [Ilumatobacteraceae bacterium]
MAETRSIGGQQPDAEQQPEREPELGGMLMVHAEVSAHAGNELRPDAYGPVVTAQPLDGVRILDLTTFLSGPYAAMVLGQLGADVVKVEPPTGDPTRAGRAVPDSDFWFALHRGRRGVVLDLKQPSDHARLLAMVPGFDVVLDNARGGVMARLGLGPEVLRAAHPAIITCSITGYGADGSTAPAIDGVIQAATGAFDLPVAFGQPAGPVPAQIADLAGGTAASQAILAALYRRERTGLGGHIDIALTDALLPWLSIVDRSGSMRSPGTIVATGSDGRRFLIQTPMHFRARLASLLGLEYSPTDEYAERVRERMSTRPAAEWLAALETEGIPAAAVRTYDEALASPHAATEVVGGRRVPASPFVFNGVRNSSTAPPPALGQHTSEVIDR